MSILLNADADLQGKTVLLKETPALITGGLLPTDDTVDVGYVRRKVIVVTAAQIKALFTTPISIVTAKGAGTFIRIVSISFKGVFNATAYAGSHNLEFRYTNGAGVNVAADIASGTLNFSSGTRYATVGGVITEIQPVANADVVVCVPIANPTLGDTPITFTIDFEVLTF